MQNSVYKHMYIFRSKSISISVAISICIHVSICIYIDIYVYIYIYIHTYTYKCTYTYTYTWPYTNTYTNAHVRIHTHTHTQTHIHIHIHIHIKMLLLVGHCPECQCLVVEVLSSWHFGKIVGIPPWDKHLQVCDKLSCAGQRRCGQPADSARPAGACAVWQSPSNLLWAPTSTRVPVPKKTLASCGSIRRRFFSPGQHCVRGVLSYRLASASVLKYWRTFPEKDHVTMYPKTHMQTDRQTDRQTDIHTYIHICIHTCMHACIHT